VTGGLGADSHRQTLSRGFLLVLRRRNKYHGLSLQKTKQHLILISSIDLHTINVTKSTFNNYKMVMAEGRG
jgi:hypothetical protein